MHVGQKLGVGFLFSLGIIITIFEIVRTIKSEGRSNFYEAAVYNIAHISVAIIVSSILVYRSFLTSHRRSKKNRYYRNFNGPWLVHAESRGAHQPGGIKHYVTPEASARNIPRSWCTNLEIEVRIPENVYLSGGSTNYITPETSARDMPRSGTRIWS